MSLFERYRSYRGRVRAEFESHIQPLLEHVDVRRLDECLQHFQYTRLRHSVDVAWFSFFLTRLLGWRSRETARAALLHDLFFHGEGQNAASLLCTHPVIAVENARAVCALSELEENIILRHMWLLTLIPPRYKEGYVVTFVDKLCASREFAIGLFAGGRRRAFFAADCVEESLLRYTRPVVAGKSGK